MARNRATDYSGANYPTITPVKPVEKLVNRTVVMSASEYAAVVSKDAGTLYLILA